MNWSCQERFWQLLLSKVPEQKDGKRYAERNCEKLKINLSACQIVVALVGAVILSVMGYDAGKAYSSLLKGHLKQNSIAETLIQTTSIFTALSYAIALRHGMVNLGAEGQLYIGAILGSLAGSHIHGLPPVIHILFVLLCGFIGGALWGLIVAVLKMKFGASELITTIMLNYIALEFVSFCVTNPPFRDATPGAAPRMPSVVDAVKLPIILPQTRLHLGIIFCFDRSALFTMYSCGRRPEAMRCV